MLVVLLLLSNVAGAGARNDVGFHGPWDAGPEFGLFGFSAAWIWVPRFDEE